MDWTPIILLFVTLLISVTLHEAAHAWVASLCGERLAQELGFVTVNPLHHARHSPLGMVVLPLLLLIMSRGTQLLGFAATPLDPYWVERNPRRAALVAAAGPLANLAVAVVAGAVLVYTGLQPPEGTAAAHTALIAGVFLQLNLLLLLFNLIPFPPLDGAHVVERLVPAARAFYRPLQSSGIDFILAMVVGTQVVPWLHGPAVRWAVHLIAQLSGR